MYMRNRAYGQTFGEEASLHPWNKGPVVLTCPSGLFINVTEATFGSNLLNPGIPGDGFSSSHTGCKGARGTGSQDGIRGNRTARFKAACDGINKCDGLAKAEQGGDPDPHRGCPKDFAISWTCTAAAGQGPTISPLEEQQILQQTLPIITPDASFLSRNKIPILLGGTVLILGVIGMVVLVKI